MHLQAVILTSTRPKNASLTIETEHPFLWLCIMAITSRSSTRQTILGKEIRQTIGQRLIVDGERNLDLLNGLIFYGGWVSTLLHASTFCLLRGLKIV